jgi:hypothetical protein
LCDLLGIEYPILQRWAVWPAGGGESVVRQARQLLLEKLPRAVLLDD